jgi:dolichol-phosphate mannosyltransferase
MYNEEAVLKPLFERLDKVINDLPVDVEVILVNDGSSDNTLVLATKQVQQNVHYRIVNLSRNFGHQIAVSAGLSMVQGQVVAILDADLQDPPELIGPMLQRWSDGVDVVYGQRRERKGETKFKLFTASLYYKILSRMTSTDIPKNTGDFRVMDRKIVDALNSMPEHNRFLRGMTAWLGFRQEPYLYDRDAREFGSTKYPFKKMLKFSLDGIFSFSMKPLRWMSMLGFVMTVTGFIVGLVFVTLRLLYPDTFVPGVAAILVTLWVLFGMNFLFIGILGEYLGRIFDNVQGRPIFIVRELITNESVKK